MRASSFRSWIVEDSDRNSWRLRLWIDAADAGDWPSEESAREAAYVMETIVWNAFSRGGGAAFSLGRTDADRLIEVYAALTGRSVDVPTNSLREWFGARQREGVRRALVDAARGNRLVMERLPPLRPAWIPAKAAAEEEPPVTVPEVRIVEDNTFALYLVDEFGAPIAGVGIAFDAGGQTYSQTTDGSGAATLKDVAATVADARPADLDELRSALRPRWDSPREGTLTTSSSDTTVALLRSGFESIVLRPDAPHTLSVHPWVERALMRGMYFDTNKCFLLPIGIKTVQSLRKIFDDNPESALLIVGHADTAGKSDYNENLSLERAKSIRSFLLDKVDDWYAWYSEGKPDEKRWGKTEDRLMVSALPDAAGRDPSEDALTWYRKKHNLPAVLETLRKSLIREYMALPDTSLPPDTSITAHGCGETFLVEETPDQTADQENRCVEVFFFDARLGIEPPPPRPISKKGSVEYPEWVKRSRRTHDFVQSLSTLRLYLHDEDRQRMPHVEYEVTIGGELRHGHTDSDGLLEEHFVPLPSACEVLWAKEGVRPPPHPSTDIEAIWPDPSPQYRYKAKVELKFDDKKKTLNENEAKIRLVNMGYLAPEVGKAGAEFRKDYTGEAGEFDQPTYELLLDAHGKGLEAKEEPETPPFGPDPDPELYEDDGTDPPTYQYAIRLHDDLGQPMKNVPFRVTLGGTREAISVDGWVRLHVPEGQCVDCLVEWGKRRDGGPFVYSTRVAFNCKEKEVSAEEEAEGKLNNLGYPRDLGLAECVTLFQKNHGLPAIGLKDGSVPPETLTKIRSVYADSTADGYA